MKTHHLAERTIDEAVSRVSAIIVEVANASGEQAEGITRMRRVFWRAQENTAR